VHLHADAVELGIHHGRRPGRRQGVGQVGGALREHRGEGPPHLQRELAQRRCTAGQRRHGDRLEVAREQERPPHGGGLDLGRPRDRVGEQARLRALPQLAAEQAGEQSLLVGGGRGEQCLQQRPATALRTRPGDGGDLGHGRIDGGDRERRLGGRRRKLAQARPPDAGLSLPQLAGQVCRARRDLAGREATQRRGH
jgi:hypothetical protein